MGHRIASRDGHRRDARGPAGGNLEWAGLGRLETRAVPTMIVVQTVGDATGGVVAEDGVFSAPTLRAADFASTNPDDTITFAPALAVQTTWLVQHEAIPVRQPARRRRPRRGLPATDRRGFPRLVGGRVDIGAVELS